MESNNTNTNTFIRVCV